MRKWTKAAGLLFLAASSVYSEGVLRGAADDRATPGKPAKAPEVKPLSADPAAGDVFADPKPAAAGEPAAPAQAPATRPAGAVDAVAAATAAPPAPAPQTVAVKDAGTVEVHVNDANLVEVLKMLSVQSQKNIIASKDVRGTVTANLYDVTVKEALDAILKANGYDYREKGNFIFVYTQKELADMEKAAVVKRTEMFRLYYTPAVNAANMIKPVLSADAIVAFTTPAKSGISTGSSGGSGGSGGGGGGDDVGGNDHAGDDVIVVTDYPERLDQARAILKEVDRRPQQIMIEAVIMRATLQENNELGVDFTVLGGVDFAGLNNVAAGASDGSGLNQALNGQILGNPAANGVLDNGFAAGQAGGGGLKFGVVKNNIGLFVSRLEGVTDTVVMANPKVLVLNKQRGEVHVGSQQGYKSTITTETTTAEDVKFLETGTRLSFRPYVGDNGYVRMEIHPEDSSGSVNAAGLPNKFVTQVTSNVMVRDGHTIVIGGLFREATDRTRSQVPGLGSLPVVGAAFRRQNDATVREEVIIMLTPHIVKDDAAYAAAGDQMMKEAERLRVGMRKGLMPWGRERLAEAWYDKAQEELRKESPDRNKALWYLNSATNLNPKFAEAIELKSKVTGKEAAASDNAAVRHLVRNMVMSEKGKEMKYPSDTPPASVPSSDRSVKAKEAEQKLHAAAAADAAAAPAPATKPATPAVAESPATKPAEAFAEAVAPATQPAEVVADSTTPVVAPATQPATQPTVVTEVPTEPFAPDESGK